MWGGGGLVIVTGAAREIRVCAAAAKESNFRPAFFGGDRVRRQRGRLRETGACVSRGDPRKDPAHSRAPN